MEDEVLSELVSELYTSMLRIRRFEEEAARLYTERKIGGFLHLYIGQEAVAVGALSVLEDTDHIITGYRCHGHFLARGGSVREGFSELLGRETGCAKGRGGSMHFYNIPKKFMGGWGIVGAQVPVATGMAFAQKYNETNGVVLCFMGDGAINIGSFHEGLSLAALWDLPVIFIVENNYFAMGTPLFKTAPIEDLSIRALGYPMARDTVDGHNVFSVRSVIHAAVKRAREKNLPTLIEAKTYRYRGHSMADPAKYRTKEELEQWKQRDPITTLSQRLDSLGLQSKREQIEAEIEKEIKDGLDFAENSSYPNPDTVNNFVYSDSSASSK
jgi:pyruvate dehydrogenase E1 component alpha subunit